MIVAGRPSDPAAPSVQPPRDPLDALWRALCRPLTVQILLLLIAAALIFSQIIPQTPAAARADAEKLARWLTDLPTFLRQNAGWLRPLGFFDIARSGWLRVLLAGAGLALSIVLADALARLRRFLWDVAPPAEADDPAPIRCAGRDGASVLAALRQELWGRRFLVVVRPLEGATLLSAARWPAPALAHLGALVFLLSLAVNAALGWQISDLAVPPAQRQLIGPSRYEALVERAPLPPVGGMPAQRLTLLRDGRPIREAPLNAGQPIRAGALTVWQTALGPLATAQVADGRLEAYPRQGEAAATLSLAFGPQQSERYFRSLTSGASYRLILTGAGMEVEAYRRRDTQPTLRQSVRDGDAVELDGERVAFSLGRYVILDARNDPAWGGLIGGALLALAGVALALICRPVRLRLLLRPTDAGTTLICAGDRPDAALWGALSEITGGEDGR